MISCEHDQADVIDDPTCGTVCTRCGVVLDSVIFEQSPGYYASAEYTRPATSSRSVKKTFARVEQHVYRTERDPETGLTGSKIKESDRHIARICNDMRLPDAIRDTAVEIHRLAMRAKEHTGGFRGKQFLASVASALYFACIIRNVARAESEFTANIPELDRGDLTRCNKIVRHLLRDAHFGHRLRAPIDPGKLIPRYVAALTLESKVGLVEQRYVARVRKMMEDILYNPEMIEKLEGRTPECACASAFVVASEIVSGVPCDRKEVAARCGVSVASLAIISRIMNTNTTLL